MRKTWKIQHESYVARILDLLTLYEDVSNIAQESYKAEFFRVFAEAYLNRFCTPSYRFDQASGREVLCKEQRPRVHGDHFWSAAKERGWVKSDDDIDCKRVRDLRTVQCWWNEWTYAWDANPPRTRRKTLA